MLKLTGSLAIFLFLFHSQISHAAAGANEMASPTVCLNDLSLAKASAVSDKDRSSIDVIDHDLRIYSGLLKDLNEATTAATRRYTIEQIDAVWKEMYAVYGTQIKEMGLSAALKQQIWTDCLQ